MNASTVTRTNLFNLSDLQRYCGMSSEFDTTFGPFGQSHSYADYRQRGGVVEKLLQMGAVDRGERDTCGYRYAWIVESAATYNEAAIENAHHDARISNEAYDLMSTLAGPAVISEPVINRQAQADAIAVMRRREEQSARDIEELRRTVAFQRSTINRLESPITEGSDSRLDEFWTIAGQAASDEGFCPEYDRLAERLGGQSRRADYTVTLAVHTSVTVSLSGIQRGEEITMRMVRDQLTSSDIEQQINIDWDDLEVEEYEED